ncbi:MAG TPA: glycosyltransferase family 4 protein [Candidatus Margulisiibacteriota bacterium]|nr:glycosyltransferase family 4 protein [Candidatus Margulisiibacteriota bacterium]
MVRVLFVEASSGGVVGGSLTGLCHLIRGLDRNCFEPTMVLYERKAIESELQEIGVAVHHVARRRMPKQHALLSYDGYHRAKSVGAVRSVLRLGRQTLRVAIEELPAAARLARVIRAVGADVVHLGNGVRANFDGILACWLTRTPCVCHVKGFEKYSNRERWAARHIDALVCMTEAVRAHCAQRGVHGRTMHVVYDALDEAAFAPQRAATAVRAELGITNGVPCVGVIGNIQEWKGQGVLVEAMARIVEQVPQAHGFIVGGVHRAGTAYNERLMRRIQELKLNGALSTTGFRRDVADVINALDVVVHTSVRPEPFGRVILEGMLLGKPVVASAAGGVPELIRDGETGFLTPPGDAARLADRVIPLLRDPTLRRRIGAQARAWARDHLSLRRHVAAMSTIYESLARAY